MIVRYRFDMIFAVVLDMVLMWHTFAGRKSERHPLQSHIEQAKSTNKHHNLFQIRIISYLCYND